MIKYSLLLIFSLYSVLAFNQKFNNKESLVFNDNEESFKILNGKLDNYDLVVIGEEHFLEANVDFQFELFKHLYYKNNVKHILVEYGVSRGILVNLFFETGNADILRRLAQEKVDYHFYLKLKSFYDSLPADEKFKVHGIDYEKDGIGRVKYAILKIIDNIKTDSIQLSKNTLNFIDSCDLTDDYNGEGKKMILSFLNELELDTSKYKMEFGIFFQDLLLLNKALQFDEKKSKKNNSFNNERENLIFKQAISLKNLYKEDKFYCIFGTAHIPLKMHKNWASIDDFEHFVSMLNTKKDSPFKSKIFSILPLYKSCLPPWKKHYAKRNLGLSINDLKELDENSKGSLYTLFECPKESEEQRKYWENYYQMILINRY